MLFRHKQQVLSLLLHLWFFVLLLFLGVECVRDSPATAKELRSRQMRTQSQVQSTIFQQDYDPNMRPPVRALAAHPSIVVTLSLVLNRIVWHTHSAEVDLILKQEWEDSRLAFNIDPREGVHEVLLPKNQTVWRPDTFFVGAQEQAPAIGTRAVERSRTLIEQSGYVRSEDRRTLRANFQSGGAFPIRDHRTIKFALSSAIYPIEDVAYLWANSPPLIQPIQIAEHLYEGGGAQYAFEEAEAGECHGSGNFSASSFSCVELIVRFHRSAIHGWFNVLLPSILLVFANWLHFWVHPSWSVPRTLSAAVPFLLFACFLLLMPIESCALRIWLLICTVFTLFSLIEYFLIIRCYSTVKSTHLTTIQRQNRPPSGQNNYEDGKEVVIVTQDEPLLTNNVESHRHRNNGNRLDLISRLAFPIGFIIAIVIFVLFYTF